jgi:predicted dehydrogenase
MGMRIGVVGLGFFGKILLDVLRKTPGADVVALHDRFPGKADEIELRGARFFGKLEDLFDQQPLDAVVIAEIPGYHRRVTELAAAKGINVY